MKNQEQISNEFQVEQLEQRLEMCIITQNWKGQIEVDCDIYNTELEGTD